MDYPIQEDQNQFLQVESVQPFAMLWQSIKKGELISFLFVFLSMSWV